MKKKLCLLAAAVVCLCLLAGCECKHQWMDATCTQAKTCEKCGETEGEPLGHRWQEATCTTPRTCTVCGETEGEALGHTWQEANYQDPKICLVCGTTEGEPLTPAFEANSLPINLYETWHTLSESGGDAEVVWRDPFAYVTACYSDSSKKTTGELHICDYRIFESDESHAAVPGYEWRAFDVRITFSDDNARKSGMQVICCMENYYDIDGWDASESTAEGTQWDYLSETGTVHTASIHGQEQPILISMENEAYLGWVNHTNTYTASFYCCVPQGYDGVVIGFYDSSIPWEEGMHIYNILDENTLLFRLGNDTAAWWE